MLAQLSDPHLGADPVHGEARLAAAVAAVAALEPAPDAVLVSGDLTDHGTATEYARVRALLAPLRMPVHVLPGNHDDRAALRAAFPVDPGATALHGPGEDPAARYRYAVRCGPLRLVACDSIRPGHDDGSLGEDGLAWLDAALADDPSVPTIVALHHPPLVFGMPALDAIGLPGSERAALARLLGRHPQVRRVVGGHLHRTAFGVVGSCPLVVGPSVHTTIKLQLGAAGYEAAPDPPAILVHALAGGELVTHVQPVS